MASVTKNSSDINSTAGLSPGDRATDDKDNASGTPQDQVLLQALQAFIIPLIRGQSNIIQTDLGPEAEKLITALREFISSVVVRPELSAKKMVEVGWVEGTGETELEGSIDDEDKENDHNSQNDSGHDSENDKEVPINDESSSVCEADRDTTGEESDYDLAYDEQDDQSLMESPPVEAERIYVIFRNSETTFRDKVLSALREHVFNKMPIRLLSFELHGSSFQITLLERGDIHARLVSALPENLDEPDHHPDEDCTEAKLNEEEAIESLISKHAGYGILSHTWLATTPGEITYCDWNKALFDANSLGYQKLINFCQTAWRDHGLTFGWMDTICINKDSSSELDESIRSMYSWYQRADVCIVYLAETGTLQTMHDDPWFSRGWTLQEMLAPRVLKFYSKDWKRLSGFGSDQEDKNITRQIEQATTITMDELEMPMTRIRISRKMQMAANRKVTREEDTAYSLMGIFDVSIAIAYGEGAKRAFSRLLEAILMTYNDNMMEIFNWAGRVRPFQVLNSQLLPDSPQNYEHRSPNVPLGPPMEPLTLTQRGLRIPVILMPAISTTDPNFEYNPIGDYKATVDLSPYHIDAYRPLLYKTHHLLDSQCSGRDGEKGDGLYQTTFAVLNFYGGTANTINIPKTCFAMALNCYMDAGKVSTSGGIHVYRTAAPIVFNLEKSVIVNNNEDREYQYFFEIEIAELPKHGIQLVTLYL